MVPNMITNFDIVAILPEILILILIAVVLVVDVIRKKQPGGNTLSWVTFIGLVIVIFFSVFFLSPGESSRAAWGGMVRVDATSHIFTLIILIGAALTTLFSMHHPNVQDKGEYYALLLLSVIGMSMMVASTNIILLYLAIETTAIPLYVLVGFLKNDRLSVESGLKYFLFGALTSAVLLYGLSLLYGFSGSTHYSEIIEAINGGAFTTSLLVFILLLTIVGFGAKISSFPFHFWAPDAYHGAPTPIAGYLSTASKAVGFVVLMRFMASIYSSEPQSWTLLLAIMATATMFVGNLLALVQKDLKRLFAYSSIAHAGYALIGLAAGTQLGFQAAMYYLIAYLFTNIAIFGIILIVERTKGSTELGAFKGLMKQSPGIALVFLIAILSLGGIPPFGGFISKVLVFMAAIEADMVWLLIIGIINSIIALYYYLTVLRITFADSESTDVIPIYFGWKFALTVCVIGIIIMGVIFTPWLNLLEVASKNLMLLY
ncbi:MAG TPA: NADH-quinone oxidoreductase subunit N [Anaerolineaceae bacterium]|nr:NADH-quinone oxidoreductase subunit N [Anaerolineaceae bacterium]